MNWEPFVVTQERLVRTRDLNTVEGVGDRLRTAAFAELQALRAFRWAAETLEPQAELKAAWLELAVEEEKHLGWLVDRMRELGQDLRERPVNDALWHSLTACTTAEQFATYMATAEDRGRIAGERFAKELGAFDAKSAQIFGQIALEERRHIELARRYFSSPKLENTL